MNSVNLIPRARVAAQRRRARLRIWAMVVGLFAGGLVIAYVGLSASWGGRDTDMVGESQSLAKRITDAKKRITASKAALREAKAKAGAIRAIADQPDWGLLLSLISSKLGTKAVLDACRIEPVKSADAALAAGTPGAPGKTVPVRVALRPERYTLVLTGVADSQDIASQVALDLKQTGLFQGVRIETGRKPFMGLEGVSFRIECAIVDSGGGDR